MTAAPALASDDAGTARARIRDAAIARFGEHGVATTSLKTIAADAGVSPALIIHHFGSKDALRRACDHHAAATIRTRKHAAMSEGTRFDLLGALRGADDDRPVVRYLARTLVDGSPHVAALVDELVDDAEDYLADGERSGLIAPSDHPRARAAILTLWSLGALTLHEHLERLLGVDLLGPREGFGPYVLPALELLARGVVPEEIYVRAQVASEEAQETS